jgi:hypothetical protein
MARIRNYRSGDRAEELGIVLMQMFCAVAPVPRQEDFGIVDAVATLLRRDKRLLYAEDSFSVQFKSRTEREVKYLGERFDAVLSQELGLFIAQVDLSLADIKLYSVGAALSHPNINDLKGLVVHLDPIPSRVVEGVLHASACDPILHWSTADLTKSGSEANAYQVMKKWLELDRWNRRCRKMGLQTQIDWRTNEVPSQGATSLLWNPRRTEATLAEIVPAVQLLGGLAMTEPELAVPVLQLISWMRKRGIDPDPTGAIGLGVCFNRTRDQMREELTKNDRAAIAVSIELVANEPGCYVFWECTGGLNGPWTRQKHQCSTLDEIQALGFEPQIDPDTQQLATIGLGKKWLASRNCELVGMCNSVFLLQKIEPSEVKEQSPDIQ